MPTLSCPTCGKPVTAVDEARLPEHFPFCSARCRLRDLGAWAEGRYVIEGQSLAVEAAEHLAETDRP